MAVTVLAWVFVLALVAATHAQGVTGSIGGFVRSEDGEPLPGASVTVTNVATGLQRTAPADDRGRFLLGGLPVIGRYDVRVELDGFAPGGRSGVSLVAGDTARLEITLRLAAAEQVSVSAGEPLLERRRSVVQQRVDEQMSRALPLAGRNFLHLASLAAGFTGALDYPNPQGQGYWANNVLVDGASHFSKWRAAPRAFYAGYGLEAIAEVQVLTNLFSAEYGDALASVTSAITKAGTNDWHGSGLIYARDDALDALPAFASRRPPAHAAQFGATLGGPLVRDRTHVFASYEGRLARNRNIVVSPAAAGAAVPDNQDELLAFLRVDHRIGSAHTLAARYNGQRFRWHREPGGLTLPGSGTHYTNDAQTALLTTAAQLSPRVLHDVRLQFARYVDLRRDLQPGIFVSRAGYAQSGGALGDGGFGAAPEDTWEGSDTWSLWRGGHAVRAGSGFRYVRLHTRSFAYGHGAYFYAGPPESFPAPYLFVQGLPLSDSATAADPRAISGFGFVQDDWTIGDALTINAGLRYDAENVYGVRGYTAAADTNNIQPRLGLAWSPRGLSRLVLRGGFGVYTQQLLLFPLSRVQLEGVDGVRPVTLAAGDAAFPVFPAVLPAGSPPGSLPPGDIHRAASELRNPYSLQYAAGGETLLRGGTVVAVDWIRLDGLALLSLVDANAPRSLAKPDERTVAAADSTRPLLPQPGTYRKVVTLGNQGRSWYHALQVKARRHVGALQAMATYTWARADDQANYELPEDSRRLDLEKGRAAADVRHNLVVGATWILPGQGRWRGGWSLAGLGMVRSNRPYTVTWGDDRNGTTQNDARPGGRSTGRTDSYASIDVALRRLFHARGATVEGRLEAFNLLNRVNYDRYVGELSSPFFGRPVTAFPPRRLQLAAVVRF